MFDTPPIMAGGLPLASALVADLLAFERGRGRAALSYPADVLPCWWCLLVVLWLEEQRNTPGALAGGLLSAVLLWGCLA